MPLEALTIDMPGQHDLEPGDLANNYVDLFGSGAKISDLN